jgi:hypothetical protein
VILEPGGRVAFSMLSETSTDIFLFSHALVKEPNAIDVIRNNDILGAC